ncbi:MFS transporter [Micromonospora echinofusca]|uniref:MFS transporter n=1 Tax=Micromonospora echinofusca TaxID=47858 RepID=A0ABS3VS43_MICEH|nr:MFS transporter [Micromonospora echinofusca]MBO4207283.1 MFS transporter [Micromonospora echinofusca]
MSAVPASPPAVSTVLRAPQVTWVLVASLIGRIPLGAAPLALLLTARESMTISMAGLLVGAYTAGMAVGQPLLARMADRWRQSPVMWGAVVLSTVGFLAVAARPGPLLALPAAVAAGLGAPPFEACLRVLWKDLVGERLLHTAYTLDVTVQELIFIAGPVVTVAAVGLAGTAGGLVTIAVGQIVGTAVFTAAPVVRRWRGEPAPRHWAGPLRSAYLRLLLVTTALIGAGVGATTVAVAGYAEAEATPAWAGWLLAAQATGALVGGLVSARRPVGDPQRRLPMLVGLLAVGYLPVLLTPVPAVMIVLVAVSGLALPAVLTGVFMTVDRVAPAGTAAESFAWVATAFAGGSAVGAALDGLLLDTAAGLTVGPVAGLAVDAVTIGFALAPVTITAAALLSRRRGR